jgi:3-phenylpropionate/cinnamic acid dioxygenase small subunit
VDKPAAATTDRADTSRYSYYVDEDFYRRLVDGFRRWDEEWRPVDRSTRDTVEELLIQEAWLLDEGRFEEWGELLTADCIYWVPITPGGGEPHREATLAFDDRRRLEDRIYWLRTGLVWGQIPPSRTSRMVSNINASWGPDDDTLWVRSNVIIWEFRAGLQRALAGRYAHGLRREDGALKIAVKRIDLIDSEHGHENLTIIL